MTAEVAIANSSAVALAADSAVTIGGQKIYNSALKVFSLSKIAPVGAMVFGNATLMGVPWETILKEYRSQLGNKRFARLDLHASDLIAFLHKNKSFFPKDIQESWLRSNLRGFFSMQRKELDAKVNARLASAGSVTEAECQEILKSVLADAVGQLRKAPKIPELPAGMDRLVQKRFAGAISDLTKEVFQAFPLRRDHERLLGEIAALLHTRSVLSSGSSGLVVAGFGSADLYPSVSTFQVDGFILDRLNYRPIKEKSAKIERAGHAAIIPFAQEDMVYTFMQGMNPAVESFLRNYLARMFSRLPELVPDESLSGSDDDRKQVRSRLRSDAETLLGDFLKQLQIHTRQAHAGPIIEMVAVLPKDELAAMAESLVNLTAFKRRMTKDLETVGGPIDVAVISKGDGLVWVKRKHYFPAELNQHFFANYFRGI